MRKFTLSVSRYRQQADDPYYPDVRTITSTEDLTAATCFDHIGGVFKNDRRRGDLFRYTDCILMDIDNAPRKGAPDIPAENWVYPDDVKAAFRDVEFSIVYSRNHMKEKDGRPPRPKMHLYFPLSRTYTDHDAVKQIKTAAMAVSVKSRGGVDTLPFDKSTKDATRMFYAISTDPAITPTVEHIDGGTCIDTFLATIRPAEPITKAVADDAYRSRQLTPMSGSMQEKVDLYTLNRVSCAACEYEDWVRVGAAIKNAGFPLTVWEEWSSYDPRHKPNDCTKRWNDIGKPGKSGKPVTFATVTMIAKEQGWDPKGDTDFRQLVRDEYAANGAVYDFDSVIEYDGPQPHVDPNTGEIIPDATGTDDQAGSAADPVAIEWPALNDFEKPLSDQLPPFPVDALPPVQREYVIAVAANTSTDPCMCAAEVLAAGAAALQGVVRVVPEAGWKDNATCLWVLNILESGGGKSLVTNEIQSHLHAWQQELNEKMQDARIDAEARYLYAKGRLEGLTAAQKRPNSKIKVKAKDIIEARRALKEATDGLVQEVKLTTGNTTVERLVQIMREQTNHRVTVIADEAGVIGTWTGRYNDGAVEVSAPCTAYSGGNVDDGRIRGDRTVYGAHLCVILCGQWKVLTDTIQNEKLVDQGFTARFLYTFPRNMEPPPDAELTEEQRHIRDIPEAVRDLYRASLFDIFEVTSPTVIPGKKLDPTAILDFDSTIGDGEDESDKIAYPEVKTIHFSAEAEYLWSHDILDDDRKKKAETAGETPHMTAWMKRYRSTVARIAAVLHAYKMGSDLASELLDVDTLADAWRIAQYFFEAARAGFLCQRELPLTADAKYVWQKIRTAEPDAEGRITSRDIWHRRCHSKFRGVREDMDAALDELQRRGYIKRERISDGGRPSEILHVNPAALEDGSGPR